MSIVKVSDIINAIEEYAPLHIQESYDNSGLQIGNREMPASGALLTLDVTLATIDEAIRRNCNLVISHHPLIFKGVKSITGVNETEQIISKAIKNDIAIYSSHTSMDSAWEGVSHILAHKIGVTVTVPLQPTSEATGLGVIGTIEPINALDYLKYIKETLNLSSLKYVGDITKTIHTVALCGGSGASLISDAKSAKADMYITGDIKYHDFTSNSNDIILADIGHYESEQYTKDIFYGIIKKKISNFVVYYSEEEKNPINYL